MATIGSWLVVQGYDWYDNDW